jgi:bifunctional non-homologous end joining protein LigD
MFTRTLPAGFPEPCLPTRVANPPRGPQWVHEIKWDGYRMIIRRRDGRVRLLTTRGDDLTQRFPWIVWAVSALQIHSAIIDGEAVCCNANGIPDFDKLHSQQFDHAVFLYAFDLLELNGTDMRREPFEQRKQVLEKLLQNSRPGICYSKHLEGDGEKIFAYACRVGLEGIVSKQRDAPYRGGRVKSWVVVKNPNAPGIRRIAAIGGKAASEKSPR